MKGQRVKNSRALIRLRRTEAEQKRVMNNDKGWMRQSEIQDYVLLKSCFRLMAHFPDVSETLFGFRSIWSCLVNHRGNRWDNGRWDDIELQNTCSYGIQSFHKVGQEPSATQNHFRSLTVSTPTNYRRWVCVPGVPGFIRTRDEYEDVELHYQSWGIQSTSSNPEIPAIWVLFTEGICLLFTSNDVISLGCEMMGAWVPTLWWRGCSWNVPQPHFPRSHDPQLMPN